MAIRQFPFRSLADAAVTAEKIASGAVTIEKIDSTALANITSSSQSYVDGAVANLVNSAPETLDTLNELAAALGNDNNFATTTVTLIGESYNKANAAYNQANVAIVGLENAGFNPFLLAGM